MAYKQAVVGFKHVTHRLEMGFGNPRCHRVQHMAYKYHVCKANAVFNI